ncbi:MAG: DUF4358 domain-containing protein [Acutalibacteraceae bacterium]|nr:DUF4358 domain-containing protein [Acutalibacteraceae bacterium]
MTNFVYRKGSLFVLCMLLAFISCGCSFANEGSTSGMSSSTVVEQISVAEKIVDEIKQKCNLPEMEELSLYQLGELYGIKEKDVAYFSALKASDSLVRDEIIVVQAMDEGEACSVRDRLQEYYENVLEESKEYLPDEYEKVKKCEVVKDGVYVRLFISDDVEMMSKIYESYDK